MHPVCQRPKHLHESAHRHSLQQFASSVTWRICPAPPAFSPWQVGRLTDAGKLQRQYRRVVPSFRLTVHDGPVRELEQLSVDFPMHALTIKNLGPSSENHQYPEPVTGMPLLRKAVSLTPRPKVHRHGSTEPLLQIREEWRPDGVLRRPLAEYARHSFRLARRIAFTHERHCAGEIV